MLKSVMMTLLSGMAERSTTLKKRGVFGLLLKTAVTCELARIASDLARVHKRMQGLNQVPGMEGIPQDQLLDQPGSAWSITSFLRW